MPSNYTRGGWFKEINDWLKHTSDSGDLTNSITSMQKLQEFLQPELLGVPLIRASYMHNSHLAMKALSVLQLVDLDLPRCLILNLQKNDKTFQ